MARLFGALANAGAQVNTNRFKRQQYDDQQAAQLREEARRALEFKAMRDQAAAQMDLMRQSRQDMLDQRKQEEGRRRDEDIASGIRNGFESAPYEEASSAANAFLQSQGMGMPSQVVKAPRSTRKPIMVEGQDVGAPDLQASPEYTRIGGRLMRYDAQKQANAKAATGASDMMAKFALERVKSKGDIDEILARAGAAYHPPPQRRTQIVKDDATGEYVVVDMDQLGPTGLKVPKTGAGAGGGKPVTKGERDALSGIQEIRRLAQDAATKLEGVDNFAGPIDRRVEGFKTMVGNPNMARVEAMRAYQRLASPAARQTIGTAMTPQEIKRLDQWLPLLESTDEQVIRSGVKNFFNEADAIYKERLQFMKASGINTDALEGLPAQFDANRSPSTGTSARTGTKKSPREALGIPRGQ